MEKRNFVTPLRTVDDADTDEIIKKAANSFEGAHDITPGVAEDPNFVKRASAEDEKTDFLS